MALTLRLSLSPSLSLSLSLSLSQSLALALTLSRWGAYGFWLSLLGVHGAIVYLALGKTLVSDSLAFLYEYQA